MNIKIKYRLFLALLAASGLTVISMFFIMQWSISRGFLSYVNTLEQQRLERLAAPIASHYAETRNWDFITKNPRAALRELGRIAEESDGDAPRPDRFNGPRPTRPFRDPARPDPSRIARQRFDSRVFLLDAERRPVFGPGDKASKVSLLPLQTEGGEIVGYLGILPRLELSDVTQLRFVKRQKTSLVLISAVVLLISALVAFPLARRLVQPIMSLAQATRSLAGGDYSCRVPTGLQDELGQLARDFNSLALTLEKNEKSRRQWIADISHELRTPIAVLRGELEALQDGVRPINTEAIGSLHSEILRLGRLVDDLYQLALSDIGGLTYRKEKIDPLELLRLAIESYQAEFSQRRIELNADLPAGTGYTMFGDPQRLRQLFTNLLDNSVKYTDQGGRLDIITSATGAFLTIHLRDSGPGVPVKDLENIFERLYRVDDSRSRASGGAGLGLSICRNIVEAHQGLISARPSDLGGLEIFVMLPIDGEKT